MKSHSSLLAGIHTKSTMFPRRFVYLPREDDNNNSNNNNSNNNNNNNNNNRNNSSYRECGMLSFVVTLHQRRKNFRRSEENAAGPTPRLYRCAGAGCQEFNANLCDEG